MLVKDVMSKNPVTVTSEENVIYAKEVMKKNNFNKLPVVDKSGSLCGIITANDLAKATPSDATTLDMFELSYLLGKLKVEKVMVKNVKTVGENETVEEAARLMEDFGIGCLPVLKDDLLVGIITESDLFHCFIEMFNTRTPGVRITFKVQDNPGTLAKIAAAVSDKSGNIVSLVTSDLVENRRTITMKVSGLEKETCSALVQSLCCEIEDIRNV